MTLAWIRFAITALLLIAGLFGFACAVLGVWRFEFVMNRMHAGGIGDSFGLMCVILSLIVSSGSGMDALKLALICLFMWCTSPVSSHFLAQIEYFTNPFLYDHVRREATEGRATEHEHS